MVEMPAEYEPIVDLLIEILGDYKYHSPSNGQMAFSCPVCSYEIKGLDYLDGKGNLEVNYLQGVYKCWACADTHDTHGSLYKLVRKYGTREQFKKFELMLPDEKIELEKKIYHKIRLPKEFISFETASQGIKLTHYYKEAHNYLKSRNVTDDMIKKHHLGFCYEGHYANRIIIPSYDRDECLNYFVGRSWERKPYRKYINPEAEKKIIIFNEYLLDWEKDLYLVEGPFDHLFVPNSTPMLGKVLSDMLFSLIYDNAKGNIIILLDGDAWESSVKLYDRLNGGKLFGRIWAIRLPKDKDIADLKGNFNDHQPFQIH